jgi:haloalkane dehalogenase
VLLLHGWPTSSYLWRNVIPPIAAHSRAIAIDLPGFGRSDKPLDASYSFRFFDRILTGFARELGIERAGLTVHDIGGPIGLYWAAQRPDRITRLALLNTLVYSRLSWAARAFLIAGRTPGVRAALTNPPALRLAMRLGVHDKSRLTDEAIRAYQEPFRTREARRVLAKAGTGLHPDGLREIEAWVPRIAVPVRIVYGPHDLILPDVERTMRRVAAEVPGGAETTVLEDAGHFLQEDRPDAVGQALAAFFGS